MDIIKETADKYQPLFNLMSEEHGLTLTISEMDDIIAKADEVKQLFNESQETKTVEEVNVNRNLIDKIKDRHFKECWEIHKEKIHIAYNQYIRKAMEEYAALRVDEKTKHLTKENERLRKELEDVGKDGYMITRARHSITTTLHNNK